MIAPQPQETTFDAGQQEAQPRVRRQRSSAAPQADPIERPAPPPKPRTEQPAPPAAPPRKPKKKKKKKRTSRKLIAIIILLILLIALVIGGVYMINRRQKFERYQFDTEAMEGRIQTMTEEEILAELNRVVEEGMFNISIASSILFDSPTAEGQARIENIHANHYHMQVDITLDDTGELIYSSNLIRPGYSIEKIKLSKRLAPGEYEATALFSAITQEELQLLGQAAAQIKLYILDENGNIPTRKPAATAAPQAAQ